MADASPTPKTLFYKAWIALRFIAFGVGGFWLLMFCWLMLLDGFRPFLALPLAVVGAFMTLFGVGEWGRWAYLWVFLSTPLVVSLTPHTLWNWGGDKGSGVLVLTLPFVISYLLVREYYRRRDVDRAKLRTHSASATTSEHQEIK